MLDGTGRLQDRLRGDETTDKGILALVNELRGIAEERVQLRSNVEQRWIEDLQYFHGQYEDEVSSWLLKKENRLRCRQFINLTRPKTNALIARINNLLFPTDDKHYGIRPSPVPEMYRRETEAQNLIERAEAIAGEARGRLDDEDQIDPAKLQAASEELEYANEAMKAAQEALDDLADMRKAAKLASDLMEEEIDDQLKACNYQAHCRDMIEDACKLGSGILKGPVLTEKVQKRWVQQQDGSHVLMDVVDLKPGFVRVDPWSFFPDPNARTIEEGEGEFERHLMNRKELRQLSRRPDMDREAIRRLLELGPSDLAPQGMSQLFSLTNDDAHQIKGKYQVWEYTGPIEPKQLSLLAVAYNDMETIAEMEATDELAEIHAKVWFCQSEVLSFALHPLESNEPIYSVFNIEKSETYVLGGIGLPRIIRDPQQVVNSAHRMTMDNARVSVGPQVVINRERLKPMDGNYELDAFKIWTDTDGLSERPAFETYEITLNQPLLSAIGEMARRDIDEMSSMPMLAQGEQGVGVTKTAQGMAMLMNSANVVFQRIVKNFDDDVTVPNIRRLYDFNMQFSEKEEIKGDYEVDARGSSVLLVREMQATNLMHLATNFGDHPEYGVYIDKAELLKQVVKANMIPADGLIRTEREAEDLRRREAEQPDMQMIVAQKMAELKEKEIEAKVAIAEMDNDAERDVAQKNFDAKMQVAALQANEKAEDREERAYTADRSSNDRKTAAEIKAQSDERKLAVEVATLQATGEGAGGSV